MCAADTRINPFYEKGAAIIIRKIEFDDAPQFHEVLDTVCRERRYLGALEAPPFEQIRKFVDVNVIRNLPQFVAVKKGKIVGWCDVIPGRAIEGTAHVGRLGMGVLNEHRQTGIGKKLVEATIKAARKTDLEKIELSVYSSNETALALYAKFGFKEEGRKKKGRYVDGVYDDIVLMALHLK